MGKVLKIDLTVQEASEYPFSDEERELFIGGKTMAAKILGDLLKGTEPGFFKRKSSGHYNGAVTGSERRVPAGSIYRPCRPRPGISHPRTAAAISAIT